MPPDVPRCNTTARPAHNPYTPGRDWSVEAVGASHTCFYSEPARPFPDRPCSRRTCASTQESGSTTFPPAILSHRYLQSPASSARRILQRRRNLLTDGAPETSLPQSQTILYALVVARINTAASVPPRIVRGAALRSPVRPRPADLPER